MKSSPTLARLRFEWFDKILEFAYSLTIISVLFKSHHYCTFSNLVHFFVNSLETFGQKSTIVFSPVQGCSPPPPTIQLLGPQGILLIKIPVSDFVHYFGRSKVDVSCKHIFGYLAYFFYILDIIKISLGWLNWYWNCVDFTYKLLDIHFFPKLFIIQQNYMMETSVTRQFAAFNLVKSIDFAVHRPIFCFMQPYIKVNVTTISSLTTCYLHPCL